MPKVDKKIQTFLEKWLDTSVKKYVSHMDVRQNGGLHDLIIGGVEKPLLEIVLQETEGNRTKAANILGINRNTLRKKIQDYNIKCQNKKLAVVILAAGKGTRMKSDQAKVLHSLASRPLLIHVLDTVATLNPQRVVVVVGYQAEEVRQSCANRPVEFVEQTEQLGTGHAVLQAQATLEDFEGDVLILCGDMPLIRSSTLQTLLPKASRGWCELYPVEPQNQ